MGFLFCFVQSSSKSIFKTNHNLFEPPKFKRKPQQLRLYLRAQKRFQVLFSPLVLQSPVEIRLGRNFCISWSRGFGVVSSCENLFVGSFPLCLTLFRLFSRDHHQSMMLDLGKIFPSVCAFCLFIQFFSSKFWIFHELWKMCFVFHFALLPSKPPRFEKSCVLCKNP